MKIIRTRTEDVYWLTGNKKFLLFKIEGIFPRLDQTLKEFEEEIFKETTTTQITIRVKSHWESKEIRKILNKHYISSETVKVWDWVITKKSWIDPTDDSYSLPGYEENRIKAILHRVCFSSFIDALEELSRKSYKMEFMLKDWYYPVIIKSWEIKNEGS